MALGDKRRIYLWILLLGVLLLYVMISTYKFIEVNNYLEAEKNDLQTELTSLIEDYNVALGEKSSLQTELSISKERIEGLVDSMAQFEITLNLLREFKKEVRALKQETKELFHLADSLDRANQVLLVQRNEARSSLKKQERVNKKLKKTQKELLQTLKQSADLEISHLRVSAITNNGEAYEETIRAKETHKLKTCFSLLRNPLAEKGKRTFHIVAASPKEKVLGKRKGAKFKVSRKETKYYSAKKRVSYNGDNLDVCIYVSAKRTDYVRGVYLIGLYMEGKFVTEEELLLR